MYFNLFLSKTTNNKQMYSPILYKYQNSFLLLTPTVQLFGSLLQTHTLLVQTHTHDVSTPWSAWVQKNSLFKTLHNVGNTSIHRIENVNFVSFKIRIFFYCFKS